MKKTEAQHTINLVISEIPNTNDTKLIVQQIDEGTGKEVHRKKLILPNKTVEEAEAMVNALMTKYLNDGSATQTLRKPFTH